MTKNFLNAFAVVLVVAATGFSQEPVEQQEEIDAARLSSFKYEGFLECGRCHVHSAATDRDKKVPEFVSLNEYQTWLNEDPHSRAYLNIIPDPTTFESVRTNLIEINTEANGIEALRSNQQPKKVLVPGWDESSNQRSLDIMMAIAGSTQEEIGRLFQEITVEPARLIQQERLADFSPALVTTVKQCMSCHAGWDLQQNEFDLKVFEYGTGVSCEACHGPSSEWLDPHKNSKWRKKSPDEKCKLGLTNTRQPIARSKLCLSCHIGDVDQGRVVTHAMYAAGHPPLPGIEIESYADQIPRHWRYTSEKEEFEFAEQFTKLLAVDMGLLDESQVEQDYPRTKNLLVSGVMASIQSVDLLAKSAGEYLKLQSGTAIHSPKTDLNPWPEFAAFDCAACHHDLKTSGRKREFAGVPGRPPAPDWPRALSKLGLAWLGTRQQNVFIDDFLEKQIGLQDALNRQPFGSPDELHAAGSAYSDFLSGIAAQIQSTPLTRDDAILVLKLLTGTEQNSIFSPEAESWDFHSARQIGWAIQLVSAELNQQRNSGRQHLSGDITVFENDVADALSDMQDYLMLELAATGEITPLQTKFLNAWRNFDRNRFLKIIERFSVALRESELAIKDRQP